MTPEEQQETTAARYASAASAAAARAQAAAQHASDAAESSEDNLAHSAAALAEQHASEARSGADLAKQSHTDIQNKIRARASSPKGRLRDTRSKLSDARTEQAHYAELNQLSAHAEHYAVAAELNAKLASAYAALAGNDTQRRRIEERRVRIELDAAQLNDARIATAVNQIRAATIDLEHQRERRAAVAVAG